MVVALGGAPVELVVAADMSLHFLQVTTDPMFMFRVREKIALRIKEAAAISYTSSSRRNRGRSEACPSGSSSSAAALRA